MNGYGGTVGTVGCNNVGNAGTAGTVTYSGFNGVSAANGRRNGTLHSAFPLPRSSDTSESNVVSTTVVTNARGILGVALLLWRAGRRERIVCSKNILRRSSCPKSFATTGWPLFLFCDLVTMTSEPFKRSVVLEPDILLEPDSVLDIFCDAVK